jgi:hypothetical protein
MPLADLECETLKAYLAMHHDYKRSRRNQRLERDDPAKYDAITAQFSLAQFVVGGSLGFGPAVWNLRYAASSG